MALATMSPFSLMAGSAKPAKNRLGSTPEGSQPSSSLARQIGSGSATGSPGSPAKNRYSASLTLPPAPSSSVTLATTLSALLMAGSAKPAKNRLGPT